MRYEGTDGYQAECLEDDIFLSEVPVSLIKESIHEQFDNPLINKTDYVSNFIDVCEVSREQLDDEDMDGDDKNALRHIREDFYVYLRQLFRDYLNLGFPNFEDLSEDEQDELMRNTYRYFILNIKKNYSRMVTHYIDSHKSEIESICEQKKDVTTMAYKKSIKNEYDLLVISNIYTVVPHILDSDIDVDEFLRNSCGKNDCECEYVMDAYDRFLITGNFIDRYREMIGSDLRATIANKVREKILKRSKQ